MYGPCFGMHTKSGVVITKIYMAYDHRLAFTYACKQASVARTNHAYFFFLPGIDMEEIFLSVSDRLSHDLGGIA